MSSYPFKCRIHQMIPEPMSGIMLPILQGSFTSAILQTSHLQCLSSGFGSLNAFHALSLTLGYYLLTGLIPGMCWEERNKHLDEGYDCHVSSAALKKLLFIISLNALLVQLAGSGVQHPSNGSVTVSNGHTPEKCHSAPLFYGNIHDCHLLYLEIEQCLYL